MESIVKNVKQDSLILLAIVKILVALKILNTKAPPKMLTYPKVITLITFVNNIKMNVMLTVLGAGLLLMLYNVKLVNLQKKPFLLLQTSIKMEALVFKRVLMDSIKIQLLKDGKFFFTYKKNFHFIKKNYIKNQYSKFKKNI
jgi:hypothetical protein